MFALFASLTVFATLLAQTTLFGPFALWGARPDLCLIATVYFGLYWNLNRSLVVGAVLGLLQDTLGSGLVGTNLLTKAVFVFSLGLVQRHLRSTTWLTQLVVTSFLSLVDGVFFLGLTRTVSPATVGAAQALPLLLLQIVVSGALAPVVIVGIERLRALFRLPSDLIGGLVRLRGAAAAPP
ncbi:MAG: rod shape-determining protein MreD [Candidatus Tectomicrobia bacterium]|nr:rod shape-determining protein MreD [Candidatus Tectomicrobia bacterium]